MRDFSSLKEERTIRLIRVVNECVLSTYGSSVKDIILYGSFARGDQAADSDVDIMILLDPKQLPGRKAKEQLAELVADLSIDSGILVSIVETNEDDFQLRKNDIPFYRNVSNEGILTYAS